MISLLHKITESKAVVHKTLDAAWERNEVISQNIANVNTPGYKRKVVTFEEALKAAFEKPGFSNEEVKHIDIEVKQINDTSARLDGNNVNVDVEMTNLAKNTIKYNALAQMADYSKTLKVIRSFGSGG